MRSKVIANIGENKVATELRKALTDTYSLYFKTQSYHWNVEGAHFHDLHILFEEQYTEMWNATDLLAERLRALGEYAPANHGEMISGSDINQDDKIPKANEMIENLIEGHEAVMRNLGNAFLVSQKNNDEVTADILSARMQSHEKTLWMLRSSTK